MLKIKDLAVSKELDTKGMAKVVGGLSLLPLFVNNSVRMDNKVVDMDQVFALKLDQANGGMLTNNQGIVGGNGTVEANVNQALDQDNAMIISGLGNARIA